MLKKAFVIINRTIIVLLAVALITVSVMVVMHNNQNEELLSMHQTIEQVAYNTDATTLTVSR